MPASELLQIPNCFIKMKTDFQFVIQFVYKSDTYCYPKKFVSGSYNNYCFQTDYLARNDNNLHST